MSGPDHYREAERLLDGPNFDAYDDMETWRQDRADSLAEAQVHATLALAAATALTDGMAWAEAVLS